MAKISNTNDAVDAVETVIIEPEENQLAMPADITQEPLKEVRLLIDYAEHKSGCVAELPESVAQRLIESGAADDSAEAIAYARSV
jgi:hypothetical protein